MKNRATTSSLLFASLLLILRVTATPDCYDFSVSNLRDDYFEVLPKLLFYGQVDWLELQSGRNCAFYTYGDVFFKSYH